MAPKTTTTASASSSTSRNSSRITRNSNSNSTQNMAQVSSQMMNSNEYTDAYSGLVYQADAMAAVAYTMAPSYAYNAFADTTGMGMYIGDNSSYINTSNQLNWMGLDPSAAFPTAPTAASSIYTDPGLRESSYDDGSAIEVALEDTPAKPKRSRPNRYKNAHPVVKDRRRLQNREAQRKYRERKETRIAELESELAVAHQQHQTLSEAYLALQAERDALVRRVRDGSTEDSYGDYQDDNGSVDVADQ